MPCPCNRLSSAVVRDVAKSLKKCKREGESHEAPCLDFKTGCNPTTPGDPCADCKHYSCSFGAAGRCEQVARQKDRQGRTCKVSLPCKEIPPFPCAADLEKYLSPSFPSPRKGRAKSFQKVYKAENCSKGDPCIACLNAAIKNLLKNIDCSKEEKKEEPKNDDCGSDNQKNCDSKSDNNSSCNKRKRSCDETTASRCAASGCESQGEENQSPGESSECNGGCNKKTPKKCQPKCRIQNHDFCSKFASCPISDVNDRNVPEKELRKCFMMKTCEIEKNSHFQATRRKWISERAVSLLVSVRDKNLCPIETTDEIFPGSCCLGWQIGRRAPKNKSKFTIEPYDPLIIFRNTKPAN